MSLHNILEKLFIFCMGLGVIVFFYEKVQVFSDSFGSDFLNLIGTC